MVLTDYFNGTYCINLPHRTDKWGECIDEFNKHELCVEWYKGVDGEVVEYDGELKKGVVGCFLSHKNLITEARNSGLETVLILEDDVAFDDDLNKKFNQWIKEVPDDWDMLYLGGNHNVREVTKCDEHLMKVTNTQTTHAYAIKDTVYEMILDRLETLDLDVDVVYTEIQKRCNAYCFTPRLAWQRPSISDIWKQHVDYDFIRDNDGCHKAMR